MSLLKKKSLGQNFLRSKSVVNSIIESSQISETDYVVEVGPGEGFMTEELIKNSGKVIAIEKDNRLIPILTEKFSKEINTGKLELIEADILEFKTQELSKYISYKVVANIPYYITGQIIRMFLESKNKPTSMTLLVQKEVAERIVARDQKESLLSLSVKIYGNPKIIKKVSKNLFTPVPKVDSAVILISDISDKKLIGTSQEVFFKVIHSGFKHKRKQLFANLSSDYDKNRIENIFNELNLNKKIRAEDLSLDNWINISKKLND